MNTWFINALLYNVMIAKYEQNENELLESLDYFIQDLVIYGIRKSHL